MARNLTGDRACSVDSHGIEEDVKRCHISGALRQFPWPTPLKILLKKEKKEIEIKQIEFLEFLQGNHEVDAHTLSQRWVLVLNIAPQQRASCRQLSTGEMIQNHGYLSHTLDK